MNKQELAQEIKRLNALYRAGTPEVSDAEYDTLLEKWHQLEPEADWFSSIEPAPVSNERKRKLPIPMKSLNKVKSLDEVKQWLKSLAIPETTELVIMPKFDGISWLHDEKTGETFSRGGADNEGQDCSEHFKANPNFHTTLFDESNRPSYIYGELVFSVKSWEEKYRGKSTKNGEPYKSPRNTVAGLINRDTPSEILKDVDFVPYGVNSESLNNWPSFYSLLLDLSAEQLWFNTSDSTVFINAGLENIVADDASREFDAFLLFKNTTVQNLSEESLRNLFQAWRRIYYIDGLVIYLNDLSLWKAIGRQQTTGNPLYAIAYKHPDFTDAFDTTVKGIDWKVSKAGALKPVVNIEAVDTGDCTMENPTGYNAKYIFENGIGKGAKISVTRSGGVIPKILSVIKEASDETMFEQRDNLLYCPDCGQPTKWNDSKVELICTNPDCPGIQLAKVVHFYSTLDTEQIGEETLAKLFRAGYNTLRRILDITFDEIVRIDGFGDSIANVILDANKKIRDGVEVTKLMHASDCFLGIGQVKAKSILSDLSDEDRFAFLNGCVHTEDGFDQTPQFLALNKTMQSFLKGIVPFYDFIAENKLKILPPEEKPKPVGDKYLGMKVCFTGIRDKELEDAIASQGGEVVSGVSKKTTHLIVADLNSTSSKMTKAKSLGIPIFTVEGFKSL